MRAGNELGHPMSFYEKRRIRLDTRGPLHLHPKSRWGNDVTVLTASHDPETRQTVPRGVTVEADAWICAYALLYNCIIRRGAIVAAGSVVRSCEVGPYTMVAGNPAQVIARCPDQEPHRPWVYVDTKWRVLS